MDADIFKEMFPQDYIKKFLSKGIRNDGRQLNQLRKTTIEYTEGFTNYQYSECFISIKQNIREVQMKDLELAQCLKLQLNFDFYEDFNMQEKNRVEKLYFNNLWDMLTQIINIQQLKLSNGKTNVIELQIRIAGNDGSLFTHLTNCILFTLQQFKNSETQASIISREIQCQTFAVFENQILTDPSYFEEINSSVLTVLKFLDNGEKMLKKLDGQSMSFDQIQQVISLF